MNQSSPPVVQAFDDIADARSLRDLVALDPDGAGWRNRTVHLNLEGPVLGGQIAAHCMVAAADGADERFHPSALHILFASAPAKDRAWRLECEHLRDGRRFAQRLVRLTQQGKLLAHASNILQARGDSPENTIDYSPPMPVVPGPESLASRAELRSAMQLGAFAQAMLAGHEFMDIRPVPDEVAERLQGHGTQSAYWLRMPLARGLDPITQMALLTLASDFWYSLPLQAIGRKQGVMETPMTTSLDHCIWFHAPVDCSEWLLFQAAGTVVGGGVGMKRAMIWQADGRLVANVEQRALARIVPPGLGASSS
jgi:acyl-CoA thioesterase II